MSFKKGLFQPLHFDTVSERRTVSASPRPPPGHLLAQRKFRSVAGGKHPLRPSGTSPVSQTETGEEKQSKGQWERVIALPLALLKP